MTVGGIPSSSAISASCSRWKVVQAEPTPRDRAASWKLHTPGSTDPSYAAFEPRASADDRGEVRGRVRAVRRAG